MRKPLHASLLTLLTIGGAIFVGYLVAFALAGQSARSVALAAIAMDAGRQPAVASSGTSPTALPAPQFEVLGAAPETVQAPKATASPSSAPAVAKASTEAAGSPPAQTAAAPPVAAPPSVRPFPSVPSSAEPASPAAGRSEAPTATRTTTFASETFDSAFSGWPVRPLAGWSGGYENGRYVVRVDGEQPIGIAYPVSSDNFRIVADVAVESGAGGLVFLYQKPASFLWLGVDAEGSAGVERFDGEEITSVVPWQPAGVAPGPDGTMRLEVERRGTTITVVCGGRQLATFEVPAGTWENRYGFVVAPRGGPATAAFDNLVGDRLP